jgi:DNA-binding IclR family transcriptional regulator
VVRRRVLLAEVSDDTLNHFMKQIEFKPYTPYSVTNESTLRAVFARVRAQYYMLLDQKADSRYSRHSRAEICWLR